jgi:hypothetical protein
MIFILRYKIAWYGNISIHYKKTYSRNISIQNQTPFFSNYFPLGSLCDLFKMFVIVSHNIGRTKKMFIKRRNDNDKLRLRCVTVFSCTGWKWIAYICEMDTMKKFNLIHVCFNTVEARLYKIDNIKVGLQKLF